MSATEEVLEQIPEAVVEDTAQVVTVVRNNPYILLGVAVVGGGLGAFGGYKFAQKRLRMYYEDIAKQEIEEAKAYYGHLRKDGDASDPETLLEALHGPGAVEAAAAHRRYGGNIPDEAETPASTEEELMSPEEVALHEKHNVDPRPPVEEVVEKTVTVEERRHVFEGREPVEDEPFIYEEEVLRRTADAPYIITHDEYYEGEKDYEQTHLTYFEGDDVLVDERDQPIQNEDEIVGNDNLTRFGHGSKDQNIVFVRNEAIEVDFEITRSFGKYSVEVLDLDDDDGHGLKHSAGHGGVRKFRNYDD